MTSTNGFPHRQRGMTLVVVLMLLLVITLLGLASMRGAIMQERMSGNALARSAAFQAAEGVLREVEGDMVDAGRPTGFPSTGCVSGLCARASGGADPAWEANNFWTSGNGFRRADGDSAALLQRFVIEDMGDGSDVAGGCPGEIDTSVDDCTTAGTPTRNYRITAFARTANGAEVILQSHYEMP